MIKFNLLFLLLLFYNINDILQIYGKAIDTSDNIHHHNDDNINSVLIKQVPFGETVTLVCRSNDEDHIFLYWHLNEKNTIVGPGNRYDDTKYKYEVLSGNLTIRAVSENEQGLYNCVSRGVRHNDYNVRSIRMIVTKDWEEVYENDPSVNLFRTVIAITTIMLVAGCGYGAYKIWKNRYRHPSYLTQTEDEDDEEDSAEDLFIRPGTSRTTGNIVIDDSPGISTDFKSILDTANNK